MLPPTTQLVGHSLEELEIRLGYYYPDPDFWRVVWPVYDAKRRQALRQQALSCLVVPSVIFVVGVIYSILAHTN